MNKKLLAVKLAAIAIVLLLSTAFVYEVSTKIDVLTFAFTQTEYTRFAKEKYELVHKNADEGLLEVLAAPIEKPIISAK